MNWNKTQGKYAQARDNLISELLCSVSNLMNGLFPVFLSKLSELTNTVYADCYRSEHTFLSTNERHEIRIVSAITIKFKQWILTNEHTIV